MIIVYQKMTKEALAKSVEETIQRVGNWFKENPKRSVCKSELWYGKKVSLTRKNYEQQIRDVAAQPDMTID